MSNQGIHRVVRSLHVATTDSAARAPAAPTAKPLASLFTGSSYSTKAANSSLGGVALPGLSQDQSQQARALFGSLSDAQLAQLDGVSANLARALFQAAAAGAPADATMSADDPDASQSGDGDDDANPWSAGANSQLHSSPASGKIAAQQTLQPDLDTRAATPPATPGTRATAAAPQVSVAAPAVYTSNPGATQAVASAASQYMTTTGSADYDTSIAAATYMGMIGIQNQLGDYAQVVQASTAQANQARTQLVALNDAVANWPAKQATQSFTWTELDGNGQPVTKTGLLTKAQAQAQANSMEDTLQTMGSQTQNQQLQLQNLTQLYTQAVQTCSNVLKFQFDTVKSIIGNIRAS